MTLTDKREKNMRTIYKYQLKTQPCTYRTEAVLMPNDAKILHVGAQGDEMFVWAEVDTERSVIGFEFEVFGTGHEMYEDMGVERNHIGSLMMHDGDLVFHVYHRIN
tara:strand:+ start:417 stop:734 length:318 start_codon:yes stop_codon:yes gene_type:complete